MDNLKEFISESGFDYKLDIEALDDWDLWENELTVMEDKDAPSKLRDAATQKVFVTLIGGQEEFDRLKAHLKKLDGKRTRKSAVVKEMTEVFQSISGQKKK